MKSTSYVALLATVCLVWAGMVLGVSFLEASVKFTTPSLTLQVGLDVGKHVFAALNLVEIGWTLVGIVLALLAQRTLSRGTVVTLGGIWLIVALQSLWLLPVMNTRIDLIIAGGTPPPSYYHVVYIALDLIKVVALLGAGIYLVWKRQPAAGEPLRSRRKIAPPADRHPSPQPAQRL